MRLYWRNCRVLGNVRMLFLAFSLIFNGCANISVTPLKSNGVRDTKVEEGLRYYLPKPYLLIVELPPNGGSQNNAGGRMVRGGPADGVGTPKSIEAPEPSSTNELRETVAAEQELEQEQVALNRRWRELQQREEDAAPSKGSTNQSNTATSPGTTSDLSFIAAGPRYIAKLIYLPDFRHPMAIKQSSGLFGTSTLSPTLQDGWMLTSLNGTADTKTAETLTGLASVISASGGLLKGFDVNQGLPPDFNGYYKADKAILHPGLYSFEFNKKGVLKGLKPITLFNGAMQ